MDLVVTHTPSAGRYTLTNADWHKSCEWAKWRISWKTEWWLLLSNHRGKWASERVRDSRQKHRDQLYKPMCTVVACRYWCPHARELPLPVVQECFSASKILRLSQDPPPSARRQSHLSHQTSPEKHIMDSSYTVRGGRAEWVAREHQEKSLSNLPRNAF